MTDLTNKNIDRYRVIERLGEGGMATVYKAFDTRLEQEVALKTIRVDKLFDENQEHLKDRFKTEAQKTAALTHSNIVPVMDYGSYQGIPYLVMKYISGGTLKQFSGKQLSCSKAARLLLPIAQALDYAHKHDMIHRDIKPSNILIGTDQTPYLTDFGIAKIITSDRAAATLTTNGAILGTPEYMSPEQAEGKTIDKRSDIYSLGVVFYELITGKTPFSADTPLAVILKQINEPLPSPDKFVANLPDQVSHFVYKCLAKDPDDRYQNAHQVADALQKIIDLPEGAEVKFSLKKTLSKFTYGQWVTLLIVLVSLTAVIISNMQKSRQQPAVVEPSPTETTAPVPTVTNTSIPPTKEVAVCPPDPASAELLAAQQPAFEQLIPDGKLVWYDNFDHGCSDLTYSYNTSLSGSGARQLKDGVLELSILNQEGDFSSAKSPFFSSGHGFLVLFKYSPGSEWWISLNKDGPYEETEAGIDIRDSEQLLKLYILNKSNASTQNVADFLKADEWYYYDVRIASDGTVTQRLWKKDDPASVLQFDYFNPEWAQVNWCFNTYPIVNLSLPQTFQSHVYFDEIAIYQFESKN